MRYSQDWRWTGAFALLALLWALPAHPAKIKPVPTKPVGLVADEACQGQSGALAPGDLLTTWERMDDEGKTVTRGTLASPFDTFLLEWEQSFRGTLRLKGTRGEIPVEITLPVEGFKSQFRPSMPNAALAAYQKARALRKPLKEEFFAAAGEAADRAAESGDPLLAAWVLLDAAGTADPKSKDPRLEPLFRRALETLPPAAEEERAWAQFFLGYFLAARGQDREALSILEASLRYWESRPEATLTESSVLDPMARALQHLGEEERADRAQARCTELAERLAPHSWFAVVARNNLGNSCYLRGDLSGAEASWDQALRRAEGVADAGSSRTAGLLLNLGAVATRRGDMAAAERHYRRVLAIRERASPGSPELANVYHNLGGLAFKQGKLDEAEDDFEKALAIRRKVDPRGVNTAQLLNNLASVAEARGSVESAERYTNEALDIHRALSPDSLGVASSLGRLATLAQKRDDLAAASRYIEQALAIREAKAPDSLDVATSLLMQGDLAVQAGAPDQAEALFRRSLEIRQRDAPESALTAEVERDLGHLFWKRKEVAQAEGFYRKAVADLEAQRGRLGGGAEASQAFSSLYADYYRDCVEAQVAAGHRAEAFATLERFRARTLLAMLAERDLDFSRDIPVEVAKEQKRLRAEYAKAQAALAKVDRSKEPAAADALAQKLRDLKSREAALFEEVRRLSPRLAALQQPTPLDLEEARRALRPGTLLVSYCAAPERLYLFALMDGRIEVHSLPLPRDLLARRAKYFRALLQDPYGSRTALDREAYRLGSALLGPVAKHVGRCKLLLLCPDATLHGLPFGALSLEKGRTLAEAVPMARILSATLYAESSLAPPSVPGESDLVAYGAPDSVPGPGGEARTPWLASLGPIPETAREAETLAVLFAPRSKLLVGKAATEESAKGVGKGVAYLHFACHGLLDERFPLSSGLVLAVPADEAHDREDGLLQAWEIFERCRLDARVVTLSACDTGLGREMGGEGLVGLTRAFQYAGARAVLSSLWSVPDRSTADLMSRFYRELRQGKAPTEALREAQRALAKDPATSHPFFWAGFTLNGE